MVVLALAQTFDAVARADHPQLAGEELVAVEVGAVGRRARVARFHEDLACCAVY